ALAAGRATSIALISLPVATLYQGTLHAMSLSKLKLLAVPAAFVGTVITGAAVLADPQKRDDQPKLEAGAPSSSTPKVQGSEPTTNGRPTASEATANTPVFLQAVMPRSTTSESRKVAQSQIEMAREALRAFRSEQVHPDPEKIDQWSLRLMQAQNTLASTPEERIAAASEHLERLKHWEGIVTSLEKDLAKQGNPGRADTRLDWQFRRSQAELILAEVKGGSLPSTTVKSARHDEGVVPNAAIQGERQVVQAKDDNRPAAGGGMMMGGSPRSMMGGMMMARMGWDANSQRRQINNQISMRIAELSPKVEDADKTPKTQEILKALNQPLSLVFSKETPLDDVLKYIKAATQGPKDTGIPIYVDPVGLKEAGVETTSPILFELEGVPLKTSLRLILKQVGLAYCVREGLLIISSVEGVLQELKEFESTHPEITPPEKAF
ncbi:hypothetical protein ACYOEI_29655, partial [Singulisphaera rosea]